jgi:hypothetical protein
VAFPRNGIRIIYIHGVGSVKGYSKNWEMANVNQDVC